jgi:hypothetical protein
VSDFYQHLTLCNLQAGVLENPAQGKSLHFACKTFSEGNPAGLTTNFKRCGLRKVSKDV